jgi:hypothetical protein
MKKEVPASAAPYEPYERFRKLAGSIVNVPRTKIEKERERERRKPAKQEDKSAK